MNAISVFAVYYNVQCETLLLRKLFSFFKLVKMFRYVYCNPLNYKKSEQQCNVKNILALFWFRAAAVHIPFSLAHESFFFKVATFMQLFPHHAQLSKSLCDVILGPISFMEHEKTKQFDAFYWVQSKQVMKMLQWHSCRPCPMQPIYLFKGHFFFT